MTQKLLLQKSSGCVYHYTESLAADPDFVEYKRAAPEPAAPEPVVEAVVEPVQDDIKSVARAVLTKRKTK
jgi:hypothetical protein